MSSPESCIFWLNNDACRESPLKNAGEDARGEFNGDGESLDENRRSKGRRDGVGLPRRGLDANDGSTLLPGEDRMEPCIDVSWDK